MQKDIMTHCITIALRISDRLHHILIQSDKSSPGRPYFVSAQLPFITAIVRKRLKLLINYAPLS